MMHNESETLILALQYLDYDEDTGVFRWKKKPNDRVMVGDEAGSVRDDGYRLISSSFGRGTAGNTQLLAHRLAWMMVYGFPVPAMLDHINRNPSDNRIENIRPADKSRNAANMRNKNPRSGYKGVTFRDGPLGRKYIARITVSGHIYQIGRYDTAKEASCAYMKEAMSVFGEFARAD